MLHVLIVVHWTSIQLFAAEFVMRTNVIFLFYQQKMLRFQKCIIVSAFW